jgi:hypothetical protein
MTRVAGAESFGGATAYRSVYHSRCPRESISAKTDRADRSIKRGDAAAAGRLLLQATAATDELNALLDHMTLPL